MSGSYSGVDTFHATMTVIEDGDDATGVVLSAPDKQVFDNTLHLKNRADDVDDTIDDYDDRLDDLESDTAALDTRLDVVEPALTTATSNISTLTTALAKQTLPGQFYGILSGSFTISPSAMLTITGTGSLGDSSRRASVADYNAGAQADKCLLFPMGGVYMLLWHFTGTITSTSADECQIKVQESATDDFGSPTDLAHIYAPLVNSNPKVSAGVPLAIRTAFNAKYVRFLVITPNADSMIINSSSVVSICQGETA